MSAAVVLVIVLVLSVHDGQTGVIATEEGELEYDSRLLTKVANPNVLVDHDIHTAVDNIVEASFKVRPISCPPGRNVAHDGSCRLVMGGRGK